MRVLRVQGRALRAAAIGCAASLLALGAVGCGDDNTTTSTGSGGSGASAATTTASAAKKPAGTPYKLAMMDDDPTQPEPDLFASAQASVEQINAAGGVNGRPLSIEHCGTQVNQNAAAACARKLAADSSIIATTGNFMANGEGATPLLEKSGLASLGNFATQPDEYSCQSCFPMGYTSLGAPLGAVMGLSDAAKAKKIGMLFIDVPAARSYVQLIQGALKASGRPAELSKVIFVPRGATSYAGVLAQFSSANVDGIAVGIPAVMAQAFLRAVGQQGYDKPIGVPLSTISLTTLSKLPPPSTKNLVLNSMYNRTGALYDQILKAQGDKNVEVGNDEAINAYLAVQLFKKIVEGKPDIDRKGIVAAAGGLAPFNWDGLTADIDYAKAQTFLQGGFKRLTPSIWYYKYAGDLNVEPFVSGNPAFDLFKAPSS